MNNSEEKPYSSVLCGRETEYEENFLHRLIENNIDKNSNEIALIYEDENIPLRETKYSVLNQNANQIAHAILDIVKTSSLEPNKDGDWIVGVCMKHSDYLVTALYAIWKAGASYLPIDVEFPENRVDYIIKDAKPFLVIFDDSYSNENYFRSVNSMKFGDLKRLSKRMPVENIPDDEMLTGGEPNTKAITLYTSGSTGLPKGVRLRHFSLMHRIKWQIETYPYGPEEKNCILKTALTFVDHAPELWCPIISGKSVFIVPKTVLVNPEQFVQILEEYQIGRIVLVPTFLQTILMYLKMFESNKTKYMLSKLRVWFTSGETLQLQLVEEFFDYFPNGKSTLINHYGSTEISCDVVWYELSSQSQIENLGKVPIGIPMPNMKIYILNKENEVVPQEEIGEICCTGVMLSDGYINNEISENFIQNPTESDGLYSKLYKTGDFGFIKDGVLFYEGRRDAQIKVRGHRINISEIEKNINEINYVSKSAILVYHANQNDQAVVAFITTKNAIVKTSFEVEKDLKSKLPLYMIPQVLVLEEFPYMASGKIDRQRLLNIYDEVALKNKKENETERNYKEVTQEKLSKTQQIFEIIGGALGTQLRQRLSLDSNFFDLGGNSQNTVVTVTKLQEHGLFISLTDFIKAKNINGIVKKITQKNRGPSHMEIINDAKLYKEAIDEREKEDCMDLIAKSFMYKSDMEQFLTGLKVEHYKEVLNNVWSKLIAQNYSFMVKDEKRNLVGVALNFDSTDGISLDDIKDDNVLKQIFEFLESVENPIKETFNPTQGEVMHVLMQGTSANLSSKDNIGVMGFLEAESIKLAKSKGFKGLFTTNTNPLTQQFGQSIFGYETLSEVQINSYVDKSGNRIFKNAPNHYKIIVMYKSLE